MIIQVIRTILSDSSSLNTNNIQQSAMFAMYSVGYSVGPVAGGYLIATSFRWVFAIKYSPIPLGEILILIRIQPTMCCYCYDFVLLPHSQPG